MVLQTFGYRSGDEVMVWFKHLLPGLALASPALALLDILEDVCLFALQALFLFLRFQDLIHDVDAFHQRVPFKNVKGKVVIGQALQIGCVDLVEDLSRIKLWLILWMI